MEPQDNEIIYADSSKCLGCHSCELACAVAHGGEKGLVDAVLRQLPLHSRTKVVASGDVVMPMQCQQCSNALCAAVCPTGACQQTAGVVDINENNCIGCKLCVMVCPFGAIAIQPKYTKEYGKATNQGVAQKCDLCVTWRKNNGKKDTACVEACPTKAIQLVDLQEYRNALIQARAQELAQSQKSMKLVFK